MIILKESTDVQELNIIARNSNIDILTFTDEQTGNIFTVEDVSFLDAGYYLTTDVILDFLESDHTYRLRAYLKNGNISFNALVFVTNQDVIDNAGVYNTNENQYTSRTEDSTESEYITYQD